MAYFWHPQILTTHCVSEFEWDFKEVMVRHMYICSILTVAHGPAPTAAVTLVSNTSFIITYHYSYHAHNNYNYFLFTINPDPITNKG